MAKQNKTAWYVGLTRYQWLVLLVAWLGWVFDIMDTALFNFAKQPMLTELLGGPEAYKAEGVAIEGRILLIFLIGWSLGGLIFGVMADKFGRVRTMIITILIYAIFTGLTSFCTTWQQVAAIRFITGVGIGGEWAAGAALLAEAFPDRSRAPAAGILQSAAAFGPVFAALINLGVAAEHWRVLFWVGVLPALITILIRYGVKEPEAWRAARAAHTENPLKTLLTHPIWRTRAFIALLLGTVGIASATNLSFWIPNLVQEIGVGVTPDEIQARKSHVTLTMHVGTLIGVLLVPWLCVQLGRKRAIGVVFALSAATMSLIAFAADSQSALLVTAPFASCFTIGMSAAFVLYFPELFPAAIRATGAGMAYNVGRILTAFVPPVSAAIMTASSVATGMAVTAFALTLAGIAVVAFAPETKGKPLPESA